MAYIALTFFIIAALMGGYLLTYIMQNKNTPKGVAITHGLVAALGLIFLIIYAFLYSNWLFISVFILIIAALGGFYMFARDIFGKSVPTWMALGHGTIAIIGVSFFLIYLFL